MTQCSTCKHSCLMETSHEWVEGVCLALHLRCVAAPEQCSEYEEENHDSR